MSNFKGEDKEHKYEDIEIDMCVIDKLCLKNKK